jgi:hypothetical protein
MKTLVIPFSEKIERSITISESIIRIPNYLQYFFPIVSYKKLFLSQQLENTGDFIPIQNEQPFYKIVLPNPLLYTNNYPVTVPNVLYSLQYLLQSIQYLIAHKIAHLNLVEESIMHTKNFIPHIQNFSSSYTFPMTNEERKSFQPLTRSHLPLEVFAISFINNKNLTSLSDKNIDDIMGEYISSLSCFTEDILNQLKESGTEFLRVFKNKALDDILDGLFSFWKTWDCYSLSLHYYNILGTLEQTGFLVQLRNLLIENMDSMAEKRNSIQETMDKITKIIHSYEST